MEKENVEEIREGVENLSINDYEEITIKSAKLDYEYKYTLPKPECLSKLIQANTVKGLVEFDINKYKSFIKKEDDGKLIILDMNNINSISDISVLKLIIFYLGGINDSNQIYDFYDDSTDIGTFEEIGYIGNVANYAEYINKNIVFLTYKLLFEEIENLFVSLKELGIKIPIDDTNVLYRSIKDSVFSKEENKILVLLAPSNNFWIKSERSVINEINYDQKLNNHSKLFYNSNFITKFFKKITNHKRCKFGMLSSMVNKNLKVAKDYLNTQYKEIFPEECIIIDQKAHDNLNEGKKEKPVFFRSMDKIIAQLQATEGYKNFKITNILILESEGDKIVDTTRSNSIIVNFFSEQYLEYNDKQKAIIDLESDKAIDYVVNLLENCTHDVREYISKNPFNPK